MNIDAYALGQSVLNVALIVCILKLKRRVDAAGVDWVAREWAQEHDLRLDDLEAAERARKELTE